MNRRSITIAVAAAMSISVVVSGSAVAYADPVRPTSSQISAAETGASEVVVGESDVTIDGVSYTKDEFTQLLSRAVPVEASAPGTGVVAGSGAVATHGVPLAAGAYFVPGVGQVLLTATGAIVVAGVTIAAGTWLFNTISQWFQNSGEAREISKARDAIPSRLKDSNGNVKVDEFNRRVRESGDRKERGGWRISRDKTGHKGSKWKVLNPKEKRVASIKGDGQVVGK